MLIVNITCVQKRFFLVWRETNHRNDLVLSEFSASQRFPCNVSETLAQPKVVGSYKIVKVSSLTTIKV